MARRSGCERAPALLSQPTSRRRSDSGQSGQSVGQSIHVKDLTLPKGVSVVQFVKRKPEPVACPQCGSTHTVVTSQFGSTACKALYRCLDCQEPFDYFKPY